MKLYDYQVEVLNRLVESWRSGHKYVALQLPTGGGKTVIAAALLKKLYSKKRRVLYLVHRRELVNQVAATINRLGYAYDLGIIAAGHPMKPWAQFQLASIPTLNRRLDIELLPDYIVVDEAHHIRAKTWENVLQRWPQARRLGLTATPRRLDGKGLGRHFTDLVIGPTTGQLIESQHLAPFKMIAPPVEAFQNMEQVKIQMGDFAHKEAEVRVNDKVIAECASAYMKHARDQQSIVFCWSVKQSKRTAEMLNQQGVSAIHIDGTTDSGLRDAAIRSFGKGEIQALCNVDIISEGFDCPSATAVVMARPTQSLTIYLQQIGRALRYQQGKTALLMDLCGNVYRHGLPDDRHNWSLEDTKQAAGGSTAARGERLRCCSNGQCQRVIKASLTHCPHCGTECASALDGKYEEKKMELAEVDAAAVRKGKERKIYSRRWVMAAAFKTGGDMDQLIALRDQLGYKAGWENHIARMIENTRRGRRLQ